MDTYVRWEFPFPRDAPVSDKTAVLKNTNNPSYDAKERIKQNIIKSLSELSRELRIQKVKKNIETMTYDILRLRGFILSF